MSDTVNVYTADGATTDFTIAFSYLDDSFVVVKVEDEGFADVTGSHPGSLVDASTYRFDANVPNNFRVTFTRDTNLSTDLFTWAAGAIFRPSDIGDSMKLLRDYTEEKNDQTSNTVINAQTDAVTSATNTSITKAGEASTSAGQASTSAGAASTSEGNALQYKNQAFDYTYKAGNTPTSNAEYFKEQAEAANSTAQTAKTDSVAAKDAIFDVYLGSFANEAALDTYVTGATYTKDVGDLFYDQSQGSNGRLMVWNGSAWNPAASETAATQAEAAKNTVLDVVLGSFADDAAVDTYLGGVDYSKDSGDLYFNTTDSLMKVYSGSAWIDIANTASSVAANDAKVAAEAALNTFVNQYLGSYASDAAVNAAKASVLSAGDIYFDTTTTQLKYYNGSAWNPAAAAQVINTSSLGNVGDVDYTDAPQAGDYLRRNASNQWERRAVADVQGDLNLPTDAASDISTNAGNISTNTTNIASNAGNITTNAGNITTLQSQMSTAQNDISTNATAITTLDNSLATVATSGDYADLTNKPASGATSGFAIAMSIVF